MFGDGGIVYLFDLSRGESVVVNADVVDEAVVIEDVICSFSDR